MCLVSPAPPYEPTAMAAAISQSIQKCTPSPSSSSLHGFMQIDFNKSMLIQGLQLQAGKRKVTLWGKYSPYSLHCVVMKNAPFFSPSSRASQALVPDTAALLLCSLTACFTLYIYFIHLFFNLSDRSSPAVGIALVVTDCFWCCRASKGEFTVVNITMKITDRFNY